MWILQYHQRFAFGYMFLITLFFDGPMPEIFCELIVDPQYQFLQAQILPHLL